ncbi:unnamed protein product, partial [marine sediment metagenome]
TGINNTIIRNSIICCHETKGSGSEGIYCFGTGVGITSIYNCIVYNYDVGIRVTSGWVTNYTNNCVFANNDDFEIDVGASATLLNNASDDGDGTNPQILNSSSNYANEMLDVPNEDFRPTDINSVLYNNGDDLSSSFTDDIIGTVRPQAALFDIGAFELAVIEGVIIRSTRVAADTGGGIQDITIPGFGIPKMAMLICTNTSANDIKTDKALMSVGITDGTNQGVLAF